jgi:hypothetical protein
MREAWRYQKDGFPLGAEGSWKFVYIVSATTDEGKVEQMKFPFLYVEEECPFEPHEMNRSLRRHIEKRLRKAS